MTKKEFKALKDAEYITIRNNNGTIYAIKQIGAFRHPCITMLEKDDVICVLASHQFTNEECEKTEEHDFDELDAQIAKRNAQELLNNWKLRQKFLNKDQ